MKITVFSFFALLSSLLLAHGMEVELIKQDLNFKVKVSYSQNHPVKGASIEILKEKRELITTGLSDESGIFHFRLEKPADIIVISADDKTGHHIQKSFNTANLNSINRSSKTKNMIYGTITILLGAICLYFIFINKKR